MQVRILRKETNPSKKRSLRRSVHTAGLLTKTYLFPKKKKKWSFTQTSHMLVFQVFLKYNCFQLFQYHQLHNQITSPSHSQKISPNTGTTSTLVWLHHCKLTDFFLIPRYLGWFVLILLSSLEQFGISKSRKPYADKDYTAFPELQQIGEISHIVLQ